MRRWRIGATMLLGVAAMAATFGTVAAQTAGTAGAAPEVAPVITSPPPRIVPPGVQSADPRAETDRSNPGVLSAEPHDGGSLGNHYDQTSGVRSTGQTAPNGATVIPSGMPTTGDGSLIVPSSETTLEP